MVNGLGLLDLGDERLSPACGAYERLGLRAVLGAAHEGECDVVGTLAHGPMQVAPVLVRERRYRERDARQVYPFALGEHSAVDDARHNVRVGRALDVEFNRAVVEEYARARLNVLRESG